MEEVSLENPGPPEALHRFLEACGIPDEEFGEYLENADPRRYVPFFEKLFTGLYRRRVPGDKGK